MTFTRIREGRRKGDSDRERKGERRDGKWMGEKIKGEKEPRR